MVARLLRPGDRVLSTEGHPLDWHSAYRRLSSMGQVAADARASSTNGLRRKSTMQTDIAAEVAGHGCSVHCCPAKQTFDLAGSTHDPRVGASRRGAQDFLLPRLCLTRDTLIIMAQVTVRELRNRGGVVIDRVARGERVTITRDGKPVAELRPYVQPKVIGRGVAHALEASARRRPGGFAP